jgi:ELWxxDGT repeat protein
MGGLVSRYLLLVLLLAIGILAAGAHAQVIELVADIEPGSSGSYPYFLAPFMGELYFTTGGYDNLVRYDGTSVHTVFNGCYPYLVQPYGNDLYFRGYFDGQSGYYQYDGTDVSLVTTLRPLTWLYPFDSARYFVADDGISGEELWRLDTSGVSQIADMNPGPADGMYPGRNMCVFNGELYFAGDNGSTGSELCKYDGAQVSLVADICPGSGGSGPTNMRVYDGYLYFAAQDRNDWHGSELWRTDGSSVEMVADIRPGSGDSAPRDLRVYKDELYFSAAYQSGNRELLKYDGVNVSVVAEINPSGHSSPDDLYVWGDSLYFSADDGTHGREMYEYDGTGPPRMLADVNPGVPGVGNFVHSWTMAYDNGLYFSRDYSPTRRWRRRSVG